MSSGLRPRMMRHRTGVRSSEKSASASCTIAPGEASVSRQPDLPQEQGLPPRRTTGMWPISAHWPELPSQIRPPIANDAPMPASQRRKNWLPSSVSCERYICAAKSARTLLLIRQGRPVSASTRSQIG